MHRALPVVVLIACGGGGHGTTPGDGAPGDGALRDATRDTASRSDAAPGGGCPTGSTLLVDRTACPGSVVAPPAAFATSAAAPGDIVSMAGLDEGTLPCAPVLVCQPTTSATMLFSDDPESPSGDGVLYADTFGPGTARIYVYHVNAGTDPRKFPVVVLNQGATDAHVTILREGLAGPSTDYVDVGKAAAAGWLGSAPGAKVTVPAGTRVLLDAGLDGKHATTNELVNAILDVAVDAPVKISVVSVGAGEDAAAVTAGLSLLPNDGLHDRGTFAGADVWLAGTVGGEGASARHLRLGGDVTEPDLTGKDATTGAAATLHGNYGVAYRVLLAATGGVRLAASARGGAWAGAEARAAVTPLPTATGALSTTTDAVWLATLAAGPVDLTLLSGGGSSLPVDLITLTP